MLGNGIGRNKRRNHMKKYYDFSKLTKQQIKDKVIEVWTIGTTRDSRLVVNEAIRNGVSYNELCEYKNTKGIK